MTGKVFNGPLRNQVLEEKGRSFDIKQLTLATMADWRNYSPAYVTLHYVWNDDLEGWILSA